MADPARARRLAKRIAKIVASALEHEVKDPRLTMVTVTDAKLTADLRDATVYYTVLGDESDQVAASTALASANGVLRSTVGQQTGIRFTPTLAFVQDTVPDNAAHLDELLAKARAADAEVARLAAGAKPAGDPDPYRPPRDLDNGHESGHDNGRFDGRFEGGLEGGLEGGREGGLEGGREGGLDEAGQTGGGSDQRS